MNSPITDKHGNKFWHNKIGQYHRINGPAIEFSNGSKVWYKNGKYHRLNGPAFENKYGYKEWFVNGINYSKEKYFTELKKYKTKEEIFMLRLKYE